MLRFDNKHSRLWILWLITVAFLVNGFAFAKSYHETEATQYSVSTADNTITIANLICSGNFVDAKELLTTGNENNVESINYLASIVSEYEAIEKKRQVTRANAYQEQLDKLERFHTKINLEDADNVTDILQVILEASEYATDKQRQLLLENVFVQQIIEKSIIKAEKLNANGQWLEAYKRYYWWLDKIDPASQLYSDHAKQLADKAEIKASLQDSPCETCDDRHVGVKPQIFIEAINTLDADYVVRIDDYRQMAIKAITRCGMLAEVIAKTDPEIAKNKKEFEKFLTMLKAITNKINLSSEAIDKKEFIGVFEDVLALNATSVKLPQQVLVIQFAEGALSALDRHTTVIWPNQVSDFEKRLNGKFSGIGITFLKEKGSWAISSLLPDTPAYKSGLNVGDVIEEVDGVGAKEMNADCMIKKITGPADTTVTLTVKHPDKDKLSDIIITRANVTISSIRGWQRTRDGKWEHIIDDHNRIGYIRIATFTEKTAVNFEKVLSQLETNGLRGLILDLRSNPGGLVTAASEVVDKFIEKGMIVSTCPRYGMATYMSAHKENTHPDYPVVILTNKTSASASEIVAGALQDPKYKRAILIGERTFGKGSVQNIKHLSGNAKLKYTMAYYRLPSGQTVESMEMAKKENVDNWGIMPDVEVELNGEEYKRLANVQKSNETLRGNSDHVSGAMKYYSSQDTIDSDPQLAIGLLVLKGKIAHINHVVALNNTPPNKNLQSNFNDVEIASDTSE